MPDGLNVSYVYGKYLTGSNDQIEVQYRFGEAPAASPQRWDMATGKHAAFIPMGEVAKFTKDAQSVARVTLRVTDRDGEALTDVFSLQGLSAALRSLSCYRSTSASAADRFVVAADAQTVRDAETTLVWQRSRSPAGVTWEGAYDYCSALKIANRGGEWRLPTLKELQSLIFAPKKPSLTYIDVRAFPNTPSEFFWTASASDTVVAAVFFDMSSYPTGVGPDKSLGYVRCVQGTLNPAYKVPDSAQFNLMTIPRSAAR